MDTLMMTKDWNHYKQQVLKHVEAYDDPLYQERLTRLYHDCGSQDPEAWAKELYLAFRDDHANDRAIMLNNDRKACLNLLYDMVNEWKEHDFSIEYEQAIAHVFKSRRVARILGVCLVMDRAQSLYKMMWPFHIQTTSALTDGEAAATAVVGMHWFSDLHFQNDMSFSPEELFEWKNLLASYPGTGTMNKRLYYLLHSHELHLLQDNKVFVEWSKPQAANLAFWKPGRT